MRVHIKNVLFNNDEKTSGAFGHLDGIIGAIELAGTAFDTALFEGQPRLLR